MKVILRNPRREVEVAGGRRVKEVLRELDIVPETVLVIRGDTLVTADQMVGDSDTIELRPVMSGGSASRSAERGEPFNDRGRASRSAERGEPFNDRGRASRSAERGEPFNDRGRASRSAERGEPFDDRSRASRSAERGEPAEDPA